MNSNIPLELIQGYQNTVQNLQILHENLGQYPKGWIEPKRSGRKIYYYHRYFDERGIKRSGIWKHFRKLPIDSKFLV